MTTRTGALDLPVEMIHVEQGPAPAARLYRRLRTALVGRLVRGRLKQMMGDMVAEGRPAILRHVAWTRQRFALADPPPKEVLAAAMAGLEQHDFAIAGRRAGVTFTRHGAEAEGVLLYVPGGSFIAERSPRITALIGRLAQMSGLRLCVVDYRLAPENPCPAAMLDVRAAYELLLATWPADRIVCAGESTGAGLLLSAMQAARDDGLPMPVGLALLSPWVDLTLSSWSVVSRSLMADSPFAMEVAALCAQLYLSGRSATDPVASPLFGRMHDLPEVLIHGSESDMLFDDAVRLTAALRAAGTPVTLRAWRHEEHAFERFLGPEGERSLAEVTAFLRRTLRLAA